MPQTKMPTPPPQTHRQQTHRQQGSRQRAHRQRGSRHVAMVAPEQTRLIHALIGRLGWDHSDYRAELAYFHHHATGQPVATSKDLLASQAETLIGRLEREAVARGIWVPKQRQSAPPRQETDFASAKELGRLRFHSIRCAIHYAELGTITMEQNGHVLTGEQLRQWLWGRFEAGRTIGGIAGIKDPIPGNLLRHLYSNWINPRCNEWLVQGGFKQNSRQPTVCYFNSLSTESVRYLIGRMRAVDTVLSTEHAPIAETIN